MLENFEALASAVGGIAALRELVLNLAVRGALVAQIRSEGDAQSIVGGDRAIERADVAEDAPFTIPASWRWARLSDLGEFIGGGTPSKSNPSFWSGPIPWVSPKDMKRRYIDDAEDHISAVAIEHSAAKLIPAGSVLFVVRGMILAHSFPVALTTKRVAINQDMKALVISVPVMREFILRVCEAARARVLERVERSTHGTCRLDTAVVQGLLVPLPPQAEQVRIVAKVDELMRLIDDLEAKQAKKRETQSRLRSAALEALTSAAGPEEFAAAWKRVEGNWGVLFERAESVEELRQTVLDLAVRGLLVRTRGERTAPHAEGPNADAPSPFAVPTHWRWLPFGDLCDDITVGHVGSMASQYIDDGIPFLRSLNVGEAEFLPDGLKYISADFHRELRKSMLSGGEILAVRSGNVGRSCVFPSSLAPANCSDLVIFRPSTRLDSDYGCIVINSPYGRAHVLSEKVGIAQGHFNVGSAREMLTPFPPLDEQQRIVAEVTRLMTRCDDLEASLRRTEASAAKLVASVVASVVAG